MNLHGTVEYQPHIRVKQYFVILHFVNFREFRGYHFASSIRSA